MRLGHPSTPVLQKISSLHTHMVVDSLNSCPICPISKQSNLPFTLSNSRATKVFELVHVDLWGPYSHETQSGCRFFIIIVDDFSRALWTYLLPTKQHACAQILRFLVYVENRFPTSVKVFRSDHGTEFFNKTLVTFLQERGISLQSSCGNNPAQNGRVERKNRQILNIA